MMLVELLEKLPRKAVRLGRWMGNDWEGAKNLSCGTTACGLGWATTIPALRRAGLSLRKTESDFQSYPAFIDGVEVWVGESAGAAVFDLTEKEAAYLFLPSFSEDRTLPGSDLPPSPAPECTPKQLAKHLRRFVAWKEKHP